MECEHSGWQKRKIINSPNRGWLHVGSNPATSTNEFYKVLIMETDKTTGDKRIPGQSIKVMLLPFKQENTDHYRVAGQ